MISNIKQTNSDWWDAYNGYTQQISDYWLEVSRGKLHVVGKSVSVVLDSNASYYAGLPDYQRDNVMNGEIWTKIKNDTSLSIDWTDYDRWSKNTTTGLIYYEPDDYVDFIYKVHKSNSGGMPGVSGFAGLSWWGTSDFTVDNFNNIKINHGYSSIGSGVTIAAGIKRQNVFQTIAHEHCHFIYANGHITYGKCAFGPGPDAFLSPYEMIALEYMTPTEITFGNSYDIDDYSSRNSGDGEILKVPIQGNEFFLIANRRKISQHDRVMYGDTATNDIFNTTEYGKGVYIYHVENGIIRPGSDIIPQDMESADGYWNWELIDYREVDLGCWTGGGFHHFERTTPNYNNDASIMHTYNLYGDGLSLSYFLGYHPVTSKPISIGNYFGRGKRAVNNCVVGTDRIFTNDTVVYSNFENFGDRYDAWNVGYNEVFSPYSSPSTRKWNNDTSRIFIWYNELHHDNIANIKVYRAGYNGDTEAEILEATPPSRPMGLKVIDDTASSKIKLTWNHNMEPDMLMLYSTRQYKIYKAESTSMSVVPTNYQLLASVSYTDLETPSFIDTSTNATCCIPDTPCPGGGCILIYPVRYYVTAVDDTDWESVPSDFVRTKGWKQVSGGGIEDLDNLISGSNEENSNIPKEFGLYQNFPNPFNPTTNIKFDLPQDVFVSIKIYDITGREIKTLVNEFRNAGSYIVSFNASLLSSGVYYYRITTADFDVTKRMVLVK